MRNEIATWSLLEKRAVDGLKPGTNWSAQWHDILHEWNIRVDHWSPARGISSWSKKCMTQYWNFASYIANLPAEHWVRRTPAWKPRPTYPPRGRPQQIWDTEIGNVLQVQGLTIGKLLREMRPDGTLFCRVSWISAPCNYFFDVLWEMLVGCTGFGIFCCIYFSLFRLRPYIGLACGRWGWLDLTWLDLTWWPETLRICNDWVPDTLFLKIFSVKFELGTGK